MSLTITLNFMCDECKTKVVKHHTPREDALILGHYLPTGWQLLRYGAARELRVVCSDACGKLLGWNKIERKLNRVKGEVNSETR